MPGYGLPDCVSFGLVEQEPVFLDLERDRYYRLEPDARTEFLALLGADGSDAQMIRPGGKLIATGLLVPESAGSQLAPANCQSPIHSALDLPLARAWPSLLLIAEAWWRLRWARRQLSRGQLAALIAMLRLAKGWERQGEDRHDKAAGLSARFVAASRIVPIRPNCLADSLALAFFLARRHLYPKLVFGAKLNPFAAHCWTQDDGLLLNDSLDTVEEFVPVLVV